MFRRIEEDGVGMGATSSLSMDQAIPSAAGTGGRASLAARLSHTDWVPDLGTDIGSLKWFRGLATCLLFCGAGIYLSPGIKPLYGAVPASLEGKAWAEARAQTIQPLAWGSDSGKRMGATSAVKPLTNTPERPTISLMATLGQGDGFARVLERAGVSEADARDVLQMVSGIANPADIAPGTVMPIVLGPRMERTAPRPLQSLDLRARFDVKLEFRRVGGELLMKQVPITVDKAPLRIQGLVGDSLYRSARAAGVPAKAVEAYLRVIGSKVSFDSDITPNARFDIIVENERAATGESRSGKLLYAGLQSPQKSYQLVEWSVDGRTDWFEASGVVQRHAGFYRPVQNARLSSGFGMRMHPILGYSRFHRGVDYAAVQGTPIYAVSDGLVAMAGPHGGNGNYIRLTHSATLGTSYSHLSRIIVSPGSRVAQGQLIGYVGSTGLSTGPHLHFEVYMNGQVVDPRGVTFQSKALLNGKELEAFQARRKALLSVPVTGGR